MAFQDLASELVGILPGLSPFLAESHIQRAWRQICDKRLWSFLQVDGGIVCPRMVNTGTVSFTQFFDTVTCDATASAALLAMPSTPGLRALQMRFPGTGTTYQLYNIMDVDDSVVTAVMLTLDRPILEPTNATSAYQCYRAYIQSPYSDTVRFRSLVDMPNAIKFALDRTSVFFDARDPQRQAMGLAYYCGAYQPTQPVSGTDRTMRYELWPHPTGGQTLYCRVQRNGKDLFASGEDIQPELIPDSLIVHRALGWHSYPWAASNPGHFPALKGGLWPSLILAEKKAFEEDLIDAKRQDDNVAMTSVWNRGHGLRGGHGSAFPWPIDANFLQSHLVNF